MHVPENPQLPQLLLDNQLCFALHSASRAVVRAYAPLLDEIGLTYPQYLVMLVLWDERVESPTVGSIGVALQLDSGTLTPLLKRLEQMELLQRHRDPRDERRVLIELTPDGRALKTRAAGIPAAMVARFGMDETALRRLKRDLERLTSAL